MSHRILIIVAVFEMLAASTVWSISIASRPDLADGLRSPKQIIARGGSPVEKKEFHVNKDVKSSWYRAVGHCNSKDDKLATFDSPEQYNEFIESLRNSGVIGSFWIGVSKLDSNRFNFFPSLDTISQIHPGAIVGDGDCVYIKVKSPFKVTWKAGECNGEKYFVCQHIPRPNYSKGLGLLPL